MTWAIIKADLLWSAVTFLVLLGWNLFLRRRQAQASPLNRPESHVDRWKRHDRYHRLQQRRRRRDRDRRI